MRFANTLCSTRTFSHFLDHIRVSHSCRRLSERVALCPTVPTSLPPPQCCSSTATLPSPWTVSRVNHLTRPVASPVKGLPRSASPPSTALTQTTLLSLGTPPHCLSLSVLYSPWILVTEPSFHLLPAISG